MYQFNVHFHMMLHIGHWAADEEIFLIWILNRLHRLKIALKSIPFLFFVFLFEIFVFFFSLYFAICCFQFRFNIKMINYSNIVSLLITTSFDFDLHFGLCFCGKSWISFSIRVIYSIKFSIPPEVHNEKKWLFWRKHKTALISISHISISPIKM